QVEPDVVRPAQDRPEGGEHRAADVFHFRCRQVQENRWVAADSQQVNIGGGQVHGSIQLARQIIRQQYWAVHLEIRGQFDGKVRVGQGVLGKKRRGRVRRELVARGQRNTQHPDKIEHARVAAGLAAGRLVGSHTKNVPV